MSVNTLFQSLAQGNIKPIYLILGRQTYVENLIRNEFIKLIPKSQRAMNFSRHDMESSSIDSLLNDLSALPFLGKYHLVYVDNPYFLSGKRDKFVDPKVKKQNSKKDIKSLTNYFSKPSRASILVIFAPYNKLDRRKKLSKTLTKHVVVVDLNHLDSSFIGMYIAKQAKAKGYYIPNDALNLLIRRTGNNLSYIMNSLPRLYMYSYSNPNKTITTEAIKELIPASLNENIFSLVTDVLYARSDKAIGLYKKLIKSGQQPLSINALLVSQFRIMLQSKVMQRQGENQWSIAKKLHANPYRVKLALESDEEFTTKQLIQAYLGLVHVEVELKSGNKNPELLFEMFMTKYLISVKK